MKPTIRLLTLGLLVILTTVGSLGAQPASLGGEFQVNTTTTGAQVAPDVTAEGDRFLVVWQSNSVVSGQRFELNGTPLSSEFTIPASDNYAQRSPRAVLDDDGGFVVQWQSAFQSTYYVVPAIRARTFNPDTTPANVPFIVTIAINQYEQFFGHDIQPTDSGTFVTAISDYYNSYMGFPDGGVETRRFTPEGTLVGSGSLASVGGLTASRLHRGENDEFVVAWAETPYGTDYTTFRAHRLNADGSRRGSAIEIPMPQSSGGDRPDVAMAPDGSFTVVWSAYDFYYGTSSEIYSRRFGADDLPLGGQQQINSFTPGRQSTPRIARSDDGTYLVIWQSREAPADATDTDGWSIRGRELNASGLPIGAGFQVNSATSGDQTRPGLAASPDGRFYIATWQSESSSGTDSDGWSVQARRYATGALFRNGFESGDTSAWDQTLP